MSDAAPAAAPAPEAPAPRETKKDAKNSYYYWHGHGRERAAVGDVAPMPVPVLVSTSDADAAHTGDSAAPQALTTFSWADGTNVVSVYVNPFRTAQRPAACSAALNAGSKTGEAVDTGSIAVDFTRRSVTLTLTTHDVPPGDGAGPSAAAAASAGQARHKRFCVARLSRRVDPAACRWEYKERTQEVVLKLRKAEGGQTWFDLQDTAKAKGGAASDDDDSDAEGSGKKNGGGDSDSEEN